MINFLDPSLLAPSIATIIAVIATLLVYKSFISQSWQVKKWLIIMVVTWIPWSAATVAMRLVENQQMALWFLRISFISLQTGYFALFKFHHLLVQKKNDNRVAEYALPTVLGFNIISSFNPTMLDAIRTENLLYYTDSFNQTLLITNLVAAVIAGYFSFKAFREMDLFSNFYDEEGKSKPLQILLALSILSSVFVLLVIWVLQDTTGAKPDTTIFIFFSWIVLGFFGYTYGVNPLSKMLSPQRLYAFIIINDSGIPIYEKKYGSEDDDYILFAGALNATDVILKQQLNSETSLDLLSLDDKAVMISKQMKLLFALVVDHDSSQYTILLQELVNRILSHPEIHNVDIYSFSPEMKFVDQIVTDLLEVQ